jgi:crotonobetainyl-CoA:carnitine CoA-transferase CaiB-like acyl-CoA transferase
MWLGDLGAEVIKVERPDTGDQTRAWGPPYVQGESAYYLSINRNKRSLTLNLRRSEGREIFRRLVQRSDILIENFRPSTLERYGLDPEALHELNPRLIHCTITGYGHTGPWKDRPTYDLVLQAESGLMSITGESDRPPVRVGVAVLDLAAGLMAVQGILAALWARERSGEGQHIEVSMLESGVALLTYMAQAYLLTGEIPERLGSGHPNIVPYQAFPTKDGYLVVAVGSPEIWGRFCQALGRPDLETDPRFADNPSRVQHRHELEALLIEIFRQRLTEEWVDLLQAHDVPATPVNDLAAVFQLPPLVERGFLQKIQHPTLGPLPLLGVPIRFERTPAQIRRYPPRLGEHTEGILQELGYTPKEIQRLREAGAV